MKDAFESIVKEHGESGENKVKIRWAGEPVSMAGGRQGRGVGTIRERGEERRKVERKDWQGTRGGWKGRRGNRESGKEKEISREKKTWDILRFFF